MLTLSVAWREKCCFNEGTRWCYQVIQRVWRLKILENESEAYAQRKQEENVRLKEENIHLKKGKVAHLKGEMVQLTKKLVEAELARDEWEENF